MELRSVATTTKSAIAVSAALPLAFALSSNPNPKSKTLSFHSISSSSLPSSFYLVKNLIQPPSAVGMEHPHLITNPSLRKMQSCCLSFLVLIIIKLCGFYYAGTLQTEFMVDMTCEGCVNSVKNKLQTVDGVKNVEVDLGNQVVRVLGSSPVKIMTEALE